jgi:hypothetical protein
MSLNFADVTSQSRYLREVLQHAVKSYDMGPSGFTSHPEEGVLRIFAPLNKIHCLGRVSTCVPSVQWQVH